VTTSEYLLLIVFEPGVIFGLKPGLSTDTLHRDIKGPPA
jgi:hypothetical protein